jgi:hypothetical protein
MPKNNCHSRGKNTFRMTRKKFPSNLRILHILLENRKYFFFEKENFAKLHQILSAALSYSPLSSNVMFYTLKFQRHSYAVNYDKTERMRLARELIRKM